MAEDAEDFDPLSPTAVEEGEQQALQERSEAEVQARNYVLARKEAYVRVFSGLNATPADAELVLGDLMRFCRGRETPWDADQRVHALLTGRNEVYTRIIQHTTLSLDDLYAIVSGDK